MAHRNISDLIAEGEHQTLEFKTGVPSELRKHLAGMANAEGGTIVLGVRNGGEVVGLELTDKVWRKILDEAKACEPTVHVQIGQREEVVTITVSESEDKLVAVKQGVYLRDGPTTRKMTAREIKKFMADYMPSSFDSQLAYNCSYPDDLDWEKYYEWQQKTGLRHAKDPHDVLLELEAAAETSEGIVLTNAAVLMFAAAPERFIPHSYITCALFNGDDGSRVLDRKDIYGNLLKQIDEAVLYLEKNMRVAYIREGTPSREEIHEYSPASAREAIVNAVMHRDWSMTGANVFVKMFADRLEIQSPGSLPEGITVDTLGSRSRRRNPVLADIMFRAGVGEKMGTGVSYMRRESILNGNPEPEFLDSDFFSVIFRPHPYTTR